MIGWLRGDPEATRLLGRIRGILGGQGVYFVTPLPGSLVDADILVAPLPGTPESLAYAATLSGFPGPVVKERDPLRAVALALAYPRRWFNRLVVGVDPGSLCGAAVLGDYYLLEAERLPCETIGDWVAEVSSRIPHSSMGVFIGDGPGSGRAASSLANRGIEYEVIDESGTTSRRGLASRISSIVGDRDILAGIAIALRGAYGGRVPNTLRGRDRL